MNLKIAHSMSDSEVVLGYINDVINPKPTADADISKRFNPTQPRDEHGRWTAEFAAWFAGSKVVKPDGTPLPVTHGSKHEFTVFDLDKAGSNNDPGMWGTGFYFSAESRNRKMSAYYGDKMYKVYLSLKNPLIIRNGKSDLPKEFKTTEEYLDNSHNHKLTKQYSDALRKHLIEAGYDGVMQYEPSYNGREHKEILTQLVAFYPNQIKSIYNRKPTEDPDISKAWDESAHPRDDRGRWSDGGASAQTPEFKKWFGGSKAAHPNGDPIKMYHGSNQEFNVFAPHPMLRNTEGGPTEVVSQMFFFTPDKDAAAVYAKDKALIDTRLRGKKDGGTPNVREFYIRAESPLDLTITAEVRRQMTAEGYNEAYNPNAPSPYALQELAEITGEETGDWDWNRIHEAMDDPAVVDELKARGYDSIRVLENSGAEAWAVFAPSQIKLTNAEKFDDSDDIRKTWDESAHPRQPKGSDKGGEFTTTASASVRPLVSRLAQTIGKLRRASYEAPGVNGRVEVGFGISKTGEPVLVNGSEIQHGTDNTINLGPILDAGADSIFHLHPSGSGRDIATLSLADIATFLRDKRIRQLGAFTDSGHYTIASKPADWVNDGDLNERKLEKLQSEVSSALRLLPSNSAFKQYKHGDNPQLRTAAQAEFCEVLYERAKEVLEQMKITYVRGKLK